MKETMLITGGSGRLGLNWAFTARKEYTVILGLHTRKVCLAGVDTRYLKLNSVEYCIREFEKTNPLIVIHTAGMTDVDTCESNPEMAQRINVELAENVAKACARLGLMLIHVSTDHLFSGTVPWVTETQSVTPKNVYARTKAEAETRVLEAHSDALVIRTNFYGWGPSYRSSFSDFILAALRRGNTLNLFHDVFYTPILIEVLVETVHQLFNHKARGIFHVVSDERISKHEFGLKLAKQFQLDASLIKAGSLDDRHLLADRPKDMSLSNLKVCRLIGRKLGGVDDHLARLQRQETLGIAEAIQNVD